MAAVVDRQCRLRRSNVARRPRPRPSRHPGADRCRRRRSIRSATLAARRFVAATAADRRAIRLALDATATGPLFALPAGDASCDLPDRRGDRRPGERSRGCAGFKPEAILAATAARARSTSTCRSPSARRRSAGSAPTSMRRSSSSAISERSPRSARDLTGRRARGSTSSPAGPAKKARPACSSSAIR